MNKVVRLFGVLFGIIALTFMSAYLGYLLFKPDNAQNLTLNNFALINAKAEEEAEANPDSPREYVRTPEKQDNVQSEKINADTKILHEYIDTKTGKADRREASMPYHFLGMSEDNLKNSLIDGWEIKEFNSDLVVLSKKMGAKKDEVYTLGVHNGYVTVYYNEYILASSIKEMTDTPVSSLSIDEQNRLNNGILITGEEQLVKVLEDYGS